MTDQHYFRLDNHRYGYEARKPLRNEACRCDSCHTPINSDEGAVCKDCRDYVEVND